MTNIAIITARGGSKRIPRKNIKDFLGKPIIAYPIETAIKSKLFDEVIVSTDDIEIATIAKTFGAKVPFLRSSKTSDDFATTVDVILEVIEGLKKQEISFDNICCIYPTAPFITTELLYKSFQLLINGKYDTVMPVVEYPAPSQWALVLDDNNRASALEPSNLIIRSQDLPKTYFDAGQFYWAKAVSIQQERSLNTKNTGAITIPELEVQDIDTETDWQLAELKYQLINNK